MEKQKYTYQELLDELKKKESENKRLKSLNHTLQDENWKLKEELTNEQGKGHRDLKPVDQLDQLEFGQFLLNTLMDSITDVIYFKDIESQFVKVSRSFAKKHGIQQSAEAIGKTDFDFFTKEHAQKAYADERKIIATGEPLTNIEEKETWNDGHQTWASTTKMPLKNKQGEIIGTYGISRDISDRKRAEEALKKNEKKLYELNATKDKLFTIISHDLKNLFNSILGFSELLIDRSRNKDFEKIERYSNIVYQSASKSYALLQNLLQWSRMQTGQIKFNPETISVKEEVYDILNLLESSIKEKDLIVNVQIPKDMEISADKNMFDTILRNLVSNAIKYTPEGNKIEIQANEINEEINLSVKDTGVGIPKKDKENLFRIEKGIHTHGTNEEKGTGLGLIVCKDLVEKHRGKIYVESEVDKGSTFTFTIPK